MLNIMTYEEFMEHPNKLNNLYVVVRKNDGKEVSRGASFNNVYSFIGEDTHLYLIYIY